MNRLLCLGFGILFSITSASFAEEWVKESDAFEFPGIGVKTFSMNGKIMNFTASQLIGKNKMMLRYTLPVKTANAVINIYAINGARVSSLKLDNNSSSVAWNISKRGAGSYTAVLKTETAQKTIRFVIVH